MNAPAVDLTRLLRPRSVAVLGATSRETGLGSRTLRHLRDAEYAGELTVCRSSDEVPDGVDITVVAVPAPAVQDVLAGIDGRTGYAVVYSSGFEELGRPAPRMTAGTRLLGPNTVGLYYAPSRAVVTFAQAFDTLTECRHGSGAFLISQSGAFGVRLVQAAARYGLHLDGLIGTGNESDLEACALGAALIASPEAPRVLMLYLESLRDPAGLNTMLTAANAAGVQVVALLGGLTEAGSSAAASHTSAVSSDHAVLAELFAYHGALLVRDDRELVQAALGASMLGRRAGTRVGVVTGSGGAGVVAADILASRGLTLPELSAGLRQELAAQLPEIASTRNPVDVTAQTIGDNDVLAGVCATLRDSGEVDLLLVIGREDQADAAGALTGASTPAAVALLDRDASGVRARIERGQVVLPDLATACTVLAAAAAGTDAGGGGLRPVTLVGVSGSTPPTASESLALVEKAGIEVAPWRLVSGTSETLGFGAAEGWPVVLKADLPAEVHKASAGGVRLDVYGETAAQHTRAMLKTGHRIIAARQLRTSLELFAGVRRDPQWGLVVSAGLGGSNIELLDLTVAVPAHLPAEWLARRLDEHVFGRVPGRYEGIAHQLAKIAYALADLAAESGFGLVECNPLALVDGRIVALDARVVAR